MIAGLRHYHPTDHGKKNPENIKCIFNMEFPVILRAHLYGMVYNRDILLKSYSGVIFKS